MRIRTRLVILSVALTIAGSAILLFVRERRAEGLGFILKTRQTELARLFNRVVDYQGNPLLTMITDYTYWDDMARFVSAPDPEWAKQNIDASFSTFNVDVAWVFNPQHECIHFATSEHASDIRQDTISGDLMAKILDTKRLTHFFMKTPQGLLEIRAATIHPTDDPERKTPPQGCMVIGRLWDEEHLRTTSDLVHAEATLVPPIDNEFEATSSTDLFGLLIVRRPLKDWHGSPVDVLQLRSVSPAIAKFMNMVNWGFALIIVLTAFGLVSSSWFLISWVVSPLRAISESLDMDSPAPIGKLSRARNEFGHIAQLITKSFEQQQELRNEVAERRRAEEELSRHQQFLQMVIDGIPEGLVVVDDQMQLILANRRIGELAGRPDLVSLCSSCLGATGGSESRRECDHVECPMRKALHSNAPVLAVRQIRQTNGTTITLEIVAAPILGEQGTATHVVGTWRDISARVKAEESLRVSEERLRLTLEATSDAVWDWNVQTGEAFFTPRYYTMLGYDPYEFPSSYEAWLNLLHPEERPHVEELLRNHFEKRQSTFEMEFRLRASDGTFKWILARGKAVQYDAEGNPLRMVGTHTDVTARKETEQVLQREYSFRDAVIQRTAEGLCVFHDIAVPPFTEFTIWNDRMTEITGFSQDEINRRGWRKTLFPDRNTRQSVLIRTRLARRGADLQREEWTIVRADGQKREVSLSTRWVGSLDGTVHTLGLFQDITDRRTAERAVEERVRELSFLHECSQHVASSLSIDTVASTALEEMMAATQADFAMFFVRDHDQLKMRAQRHRLTAFDTGAMRIHELGTCLCGMAVTENRPLYSRDIHADPRCTLDECRQAGIRSFAALPLVSAEGSLGVLGVASFFERDFSTQRTFLETIASQISVALQNALLFERVRNHAAELEKSIDERNRAEEALRESEERFRAMIENTSDIITIITKDAVIEYQSPSFERLLGYLPGEVIGRSALDLLHEEDIARVLDVLAQVAKNPGETHAAQYRMRHKNGTWRFLESVGKPVVSESGQLKVIVSSRDITERLQAEQEAILRQRQLLQADKMASLGLLVSGVAHEINNPNFLVMANTSVLMKAWSDIVPILDRYYEEHGDFMLGGGPYSVMKEETKTLFGDIQAGAERIKYIVQELRDYAREQPTDVTAPVDVNAVVKSATALLSNMTRKSTSRFSVEYGDPMPRIRGDFQRIEQVVVNLVQNACQALPNENCAVSVRTLYDAPERMVVIEVHDEGIGIPPEDLPRVTDPFFTTRRDSGGTGLGLSISAGIVNNHGGKLVFTSDPVEGTTARIILPVEHVTSVMES